MPVFCVREGCQTRANFGVPGTRKATHCAKHKLDGYVNVKKRTCAHKDCQTRAYFGVPGTRKATHCAKHKLDGYVDVYRACAHEDCRKFPHFGDPKFGKKTYCAEHKPDGYVDLTNPVCAEDGCTIRASFGDPTTGKKTHCTKHKLDGHVDLKHERCNEAGCKRIPHFGDPKIGKKTHCAEHKPDGYVDLTNPSCKSDHCATTANAAYDGYCAHCFRHLFPLDPRATQIRAKTRELIVRDALVEWYGDAFVHDETLHFGCDCAHKRSVDFRRLVGNTMIAVEVDERQHKSYDAEDENVRYDDLFVAFGGKWIYIRFNPDTYVDAAGKRRPGFFDTKRERNGAEIARRLTILRRKVDDVVARATAERNDALLERTNLFFDGSNV